MPETAAPAGDFSADADLISFLKAIPDGRYLRGVRYPQWYTLLVTVLGILSDCRSSRDLEAFAKRHREALNQALGLNFKRWPTDATFLYLFNKAHLEQFGEVLQAWMISQIPGWATTLDQVVCDGKALRGSIEPTSSCGSPCGRPTASRLRRCSFAPLLCVSLSLRLATRSARTTNELCSKSCLGSSISRETSSRPMRSTRSVRFSTAQGSGGRLFY